MIRNLPKKGKLIKCLYTTRKLLMRENFTYNSLQRLKMNVVLFFTFIQLFKTVPWLLFELLSRKPTTVFFFLIFMISDKVS